MKTFLKLTATLLLLAIAAGAATFYLHPLWVSDQILAYKIYRAGIRSEYIQAGPYRLHYLEARPPAGSPERPVVLIHGLGSRGEDWTPIIPGLARAGFHVYAPDLLGYGRSPRPDVPYSMPLEETVALSFLDALHLDKPDIGGWSMGGWVAMKLAVDHPTRVDRLMLYDTAGVYFPPTFEPDLFAPTDTPGLLRLMQAISPHPRPLAPFIQRDALRKLARNAWIVNRTMSSMLNGRDLMDFRLHLIHQPTLIVWGSHDDLIPLSAGEAIHHNIPQSTLAIMQNCGHLSPAECAHPVQTTTIQFLTQNPAPTGGETTIQNADTQK